MQIQNMTLLLSILLGVAIVACKENGNEDPTHEQTETGYTRDKQPDIGALENRCKSLSG